MLLRGPSNLNSGFARLNRDTDMTLKHVQDQDGWCVFLRQKEYLVFSNSELRLVQQFYHMCLVYSFYSFGALCISMSKEKSAQKYFHQLVKDSVCLDILNLHSDGALIYSRIHFRAEIGFEFRTQTNRVRMVIEFDIERVPLFPAKPYCIFTCPISKGPYHCQPQNFFSMQGMFDHLFFSHENPTGCSRIISCSKLFSLFIIIFLFYLFFHFQLLFFKLGLISFICEVHMVGPFCFYSFFNQLVQ